jgi:ribonucleoside-diphosphate reductase alpha chain
MQILNVAHPDIREFINCKCDEEKKAWALIERGYDGGFAVNGGAYDSVAFQNANLSVRASDEFMNAVVEGEKYKTRKVTDGSVCEELDAREVLRQIAAGTHMCGDPGMQFDDIINSWHTCPQSGRINASNPCSEYMHLDDSACNLSSLNLLKFLRNDDTFDCDSFRYVVRLMLCAQDCLIDASNYPTKKIESCARAFRQLGLGYANLGALLMNLGLPYDSDEGRDLAAAITALMSGEAYAMSSEMARDLGPFTGYKKNRTAMLKVIEKHRHAATRLKADGFTEIKGAAQAAWDRVLESGKVHGFRNSQVTVLAPTGTISFMMDCDTTGIEPDIALVKYKKLVGGGVLKIVNGSVSRALRRLGYSATETEGIVQHTNKTDTIESAPHLKAEHLPVFDCAFKAAHGTRSISYRGHLNMMAAVQPFISGAISKTVNLPHECTEQEIFNIYIDAWQMGLKAVALYRDGSKRTQPLSTALTPERGAQPIRRRLAEERQAVTHKFRVGGLEGYLTVGLFEDATPGEIFLVVAKEGSTLSGVMDAFATSVSMALQYGVPLSALVKKFSYVRFEPAGFTGNKDIPIAHSLVDYIFRWLALKFLKPEELKDLGLKMKTPEVESHDGSQGVPPVGAIAPTNGTQKGTEVKKSSTGFENSLDAPPCLNCGSQLMVRQAGCYVCLNCGAQGGCG